jgi:hypothetical protein
MPDREWLEHLASARIVDGSWQADDMEAVNATIWRRVSSAAEDLMALAEDYASALTEVSGARLNVRVLATPAGQGANESQASGPGFMMLLGRYQLSVRRHQHSLRAEITVVHDFERQVLGNAAFTAKTDSFGTLLWRADNALLMTSDVIIKRLFEQLIKVAQTTTTNGG